MIVDLRQLRFEREVHDGESCMVITGPAEQVQALANWIVGATTTAYPWFYHGEVESD